MLPHLQADLVASADECELPTKVQPWLQHVAETLDWTIVASRLQILRSGVLTRNDSNASKNYCHVQSRMY